MRSLKTARLNILVGLVDDYGPLLSKAEKYYIEDEIWIKAKIEK
jgi:hypothetical protein